MPKSPKETLKEHRPHPWRDFVKAYRNDHAKEITEKNMTFKDILIECSRLYKSKDDPETPSVPPSNLATPVDTSE